jgi:hypothetical protein
MSKVHKGINPFTAEYKFSNGVTYTPSPYDADEDYGTCRGCAFKDSVTLCQEAGCMLDCSTSEYDMIWKKVQVVKQQETQEQPVASEHSVAQEPQKQSSLSVLYPKYYKSTEGLEEVDVYAVHKLFDVQDPSGAIQHASKKLLLSGTRTGGKSKYKDIKEARDTLSRWLELNQEENN